MFSANENLQLRQYKRKIVQYVEETIPDEKLDLGINVMVMQVSCKAPGCVPLETAIIIVFPSSDVEILENLPESKGGSYKTKILKPMAEVTKDDVLEALPPAFEGGKRSMEKLCLQARDVMLGQITQLFDEKDVEGRKLMAEYLKESLDSYIAGGCEPPEWGEPFDEAKSKKGVQSLPGSGNIVLKRPTSKSSSEANTGSSTNVTNTSRGGSVDTVVQQRQQQNAARQIQLSQGGSSTLSRLMEREHAPGIRRPGCPCCDPDNPSNIADQLMQL